MVQATIHLGRTRILLGLAALVTVGAVAMVVVDRGAGSGREPAAGQAPVRLTGEEPDGAAPRLPWLEGRVLVTPLDDTSYQMRTLPASYERLARVANTFVGQRAQFGPGIRDITNATWLGWYIDVIPTDRSRVLRTFRSATPLATSYGGDEVAWRSVSGHLMQWTGTRVLDLGAVPRFAEPVAVAADGPCRASGGCPVLLSTSDNHRAAWWWRPDSGLTRLPGGVNHVVALCPDGHTAIASSATGDAAERPDRNLALVDLRDGVPLAEVPDDAIACSPDGRHVVAAPTPAEDQEAPGLVVVDADGDTEASYEFDGVGLRGVTWEDDSHLLVSVGSQRSIVQRTVLLRVALDGEVTRAMVADFADESFQPWLPTRLPGDRAR